MYNTIQARDETEVGALSSSLKMSLKKKIGFALAIAPIPTGQCLGKSHRRISVSDFISSGFLKVFQV
jgi:hypothetical protein